MASLPKSQGHSLPSSIGSSDLAARSAYSHGISTDVLFSIRHWVGSGTSFLQHRQSGLESVEVLICETDDVLWRDSRLPNLPNHSMTITPESDGKGEKAHRQKGDQQDVFL